MREFETGNIQSLHALKISKMISCKAIDGFDIFERPWCPNVLNTIVIHVSIVWDTWQSLFSYNRTIYEKFFQNNGRTFCQAELLANTLVKIAAKLKFMVSKINDLGTFTTTYTNTNTTFTNTNTTFTNINTTKINGLGTFNKNDVENAASIMSLAYSALRLENSSYMPQWKNYNKKALYLHNNILKTIELVNDLV